MNVYCKQIDCNTPMTLDQTIISEDLDGVKLIFTCFMCHNKIEIYLNNTDLVVKCGINSL